MVVSREDFVKRRLRLFDKDSPFRENRMKLFNDQFEHYRKELSLVFVDAVKWEALEQHLKNRPKGVFGVKFKEGEIDFTELVKWFEELERMVDEK